MSAKRRVAGAPRSDSHARARGLGDRAERVEFVAELMRKLRWVRGKTGKRLAAEWGLTLSAVEAVAAEAWRRVQAEAIDPARARAIACVEFESVIRDMRKRRQDPACARARLEAAKSLAIVSGGIAPTRTQELPAIDRMTPHERREDLRSLRAELEAEERRVEEEIKGAIQ